jgi:hypothetical protein
MKNKKIKIKKKIGLVEWLKMKALSSSPGTAKRKKADPQRSHRLDWGIHLIMSVGQNNVLNSLPMKMGNTGNV